MDDLRYPIGKFQRRDSFTPEERRALIDSIATTPSQLRDAVSGLDEDQLSAPYRPGGWTIRQVVHHLPDSHLNAYVRVKLALTELQPIIKPYDETLWAELADSRNAPVETSVILLESLHARFVHLLRALSGADFARTLKHPESGIMTIDALLGMYSWHGRHHVAQINSARQRMNR